MIYRYKGQKLLILLLLVPFNIQSQTEFEQYKETSTQGFLQINEEFEEYKKNLLASFTLYKQKTSAVWGAHNKMPDAISWVSYQGSLNRRSIVDFERGHVEVAFVVEQKSEISDTDIEIELKQQVKELLAQGKDSRSMMDIAKSPVSQSEGSALLTDMVEMKVSMDQSLVVDTQQMVADDGTRKTIYRTWFELLPDHIHRRAIKYEADILLQSKKYKIPADIIFAIMETESMFNPTARSPVPAFGLMQLVPYSGAREAYRYVYKTDKVVTEGYLFDPAKNIELGSAYLNRLYYRYLAAIKDPQSRKWASIAAYNTGTGNVFRVFAGKYSKQQHLSRKAWRRAAYDEINKLSSEQVYQIMYETLPYEETRHYIKKVRERMKKYNNEEYQSA